jgi:hypothetical protein
MNALLLRYFATWLATSFLVASAGAAGPQALPKLPPKSPGPSPAVVSSLRAGLLQGEAQTVLVEFDDSATQAATAQIRDRAGSKFDNAATLRFKSTELSKLKSTVTGAFAATELEVVTEYSHLPLSLVRIKTPAALERLLQDPRVVTVHKNELKHPVLDSVNAAFVNQPAMLARGYAGAGSTVAVIDTGVDYTKSDFGCSAVGVPAACKVNAYQNFAGTGGLDTFGHGTNVSGIVVGIAPGAKVAALNVFGVNSTTSDSLILSAINWAIANKSTYNIVAMNMSLGDGVNHGDGFATCSNTPYTTAVYNAGLANIGMYAAAGNERFNSGVSSPGCTYGITAVGAVYGYAHGTQAYSSCSDAAGPADQITCFSNVPPAGGTAYDYVLAPGVNVTAGGLTFNGTSQATPFVAAARALKAAALPALSPAQLAVNRFQTEPACTTWSFNSISRSGYSGSLPRLDLNQCLSDANDGFASVAGQQFVGNSAVFDNVFASNEPGEPNHAGNAGGHSIWAQYTPSITGPIRVDTHASSIDTLLAVYTGVAVSGLTAVASNDDDGTPGGGSSVIFNGVAATSYKFAVDGKNGAIGNFVLSINPLSADLSLSVASTEISSTSVRYDLLVNNAGPSTSALNVQVTLALPAGLSLNAGLSPGCTASAGTVTCVLGTIGFTGTLSLYADVSAPGNYTVSASVRSDSPDPGPNNNGATNVVSVIDGSKVPVQIPAVPPWALALLGAALMLSLKRRDAASTIRRVPSSPFVTLERTP